MKPWQPASLAVLSFQCIHMYVSFWGTYGHVLLFSLHTIFILSHNLFKLVCHQVLYFCPFVIQWMIKKWCNTKQHKEEMHQGLGRLGVVGAGLKEIFQYFPCPGKCYCFTEGRSFQLLCAKIPLMPWVSVMRICSFRSLDHKVFFSYLKRGPRLLFNLFRGSYRWWLCQDTK